jgi:hypothetical protein
MKKIKKFLSDFRYWRSRGFSICSAWQMADKTF